MVDKSILNKIKIHTPEEAARRKRPLKQYSPSLLNDEEIEDESRKKTTSVKLYPHIHAKIANVGGGSFTRGVVACSVLVEMLENLAPELMLHLRKSIRNISGHPGGIDEA